MVYCVVAPHFLFLQLTFEDVQTVFLKYGVEVGTWEEVPYAVQQLVYKLKSYRTPDALPDGELGFL